MLQFPRTKTLSRGFVRENSAKCMKTWHEASTSGCCSRRLKRDSKVVYWYGKVCWYLSTSKNGKECLHVGSRLRKSYGEVFLLGEAVENVGDCAASGLVGLEEHHVMVGLARVP